MGGSEMNKSAKEESKTAPATTQVCLFFFLRQTTWLANTLNYGLERVWAIGYMKSSRRVVIGYNEGTIMVKLGRKVPIASMDNSGKITWAKHNEIQTVNIKSVGADFEVTDGERLPLAVKEMGTCDLYPQGVITKQMTAIDEMVARTPDQGVLLQGTSSFQLCTFCDAD
ncbi:coatomer subunit beta'-2-like [Cucumis melo var. makuwa]|uniref:Coatomer subunit beta'-2-like n=1 Tax=Cucumis melo var. makuwa TaxID=1194695 RepID=A0A5A7TJJ8_CUCMM|nr:coatomer subunit beta'-2-like [Cucumis melo var. makuwa]